MAYLEFVNDRSPSRAGFGMEGGRATQTILMESTDLDDAITDILGKVEVYGNGDPRLKRSLPKAHPRWTWLYASNIPNIEGVVYVGNEATEDLTEAPAILTEYADYDKYFVTVEYTPRMYAVVPDSKIKTDTLTWIPFSGGSGTTVTYAKEWLRYTDYEYNPKPELITARTGQMLFRLDNSSTTVDDPAVPHYRGAAGFAQMRVHMEKIKFRWFQVPFSYIDSEDSYIRQYVGTINQHDWFGWPAGSLLYEGVTARRYTPPVPELDVVEGEYLAEKLCDIEFDFLYTDRTAGHGPITPANGNWIAAGHNLMPYLYDRKFYYATSAAKPPETPDTAKFYPTFLSFPFQLLFTNPDA